MHRQACEAFCAKAICSSWLHPFKRRLPRRQSAGTAARNDIHTFGGNFMALLVAIPLAFIPAFFFSWFIYWLDRYEKEPRWLLLMAFFWGGFVAVIGAIIGSLILDVGLTAVLQD